MVVAAVVARVGSVVVGMVGTGRVAVAVIEEVFFVVLFRSDAINNIFLLFDVASCSVCIVRMLL